jgi:phosphate-selective porin OprO and OprP
MKRRALPVLGLLAAVLSAAILPARSTQAQSTVSTDKKDQEIELLKLQVKQLEQRVNALEGLHQEVKAIDQKVKSQSAQQVVQTEKDRKEALQAPLVKASDEGFRIQSANDDYRIRFGGLLQINPRFFPSGENKNVSSTFYINKARPIISGAFAKYYEFQITPDFGGTGNGSSNPNVTLQDLWVNVAYWPQAQLQLGKYKGAVSLERLQSDPALQFIQRSELQNLVPNRDIGAQLWGVLFGKRVTYQLALMNGVPNNTSSTNSDTNDAKDFVGRFYLTPFRGSENEWLEGLGAGIGGTYGDESGSNLSSYKTWGQSTWFKYNSGVTYAGPRGRLDVQGYYYWRSLGLMAEYAQDDHRLNLSTSSVVNRFGRFTDTGYYAQIDYWLTGEKAGWGFIKPLNPFNPFDPFNSGLGAWELAARVSNVHAATGQFNEGFANPSTSAKTVTEFAVGLSWTLNNNIKYWFDYAYTNFYGGGGTTTSPADRPQEEALESQFQLAF